ncbi:MAG: iron-containing alcohol dehydrogenase [Erysipelotrichaceae bacterium]|nr:iron-containing alcohol dehydrogenase [Erysipelotrichaceae bacterium]
MEQFEYYNPARIVFGKDKELETGRLVKPYAKKVLLHYGGGSIKKNGVYDRVVASLRQEQIEFVELAGVVPNPRYSMVQKGIALCKEEQIDFILAVGGGSVIDSAKAIAVGYYVDPSVDYWETYFMTGKPAEKALPIGVVLTMPAAGSETSSGTVVTNDETHFKRSIGGECMIPKFAIINPENNYTMPKYQISCGCADIFAHLMERYFTQVSHVDYSDRLLEASMKTLIHYAPLALEHPCDYDIRAEIAWVGTIAHNNLLDRGRLGDWGSHDLQHELGAIYDIYHGEGLSIMFPAWMKYVWKENPERFVQFAMRVWGVDYAMEDPERTILEGIHQTEVFFQRLGLPIRLHELNIDDTHFREMAEKLLVNREYAGNFKHLTVDDAYNIYCLAK